MRSPRVSLVTAALFALLPALCLRAVEDPSSVFMQAYNECRTAERLEANGRFEDALKKYELAASLCEKLQTENPDYQPVVIEYRLAESRKGIARAQAGKASASAVTSVPDLPVTNAPPAPRTARPESKPSLPTIGGMRIPLPGQRTPTVQPAPIQSAPVQPAPVITPQYRPGEVIGQGKVRALEEEIRALRLKVNQAELRAQDLEQKLLESQAREQSALTELDRTKVQVVDLRASLAQTRQALNDMQVVQQRLEKERSADAERIASLEADLEAAKADVEVADEYNEELLAKLEKAAEFIEASEKIRTQLLADRSDLADRLKNGEASEAFARLEKERDEARAEVESLQAKVDAAEELQGANAELEKKLADAEARLKELEAREPEREKMVADLKAQLESANTRIAEMRTLLAEGEARMAELNEQLEQTSAATASATGAMAAENALLKSIVSRQIKEQAKRQQARKLVEEEMRKLRIRSTELLQKLEAVASAEVELTPEEQKLFAEPAPAVTAAGTSTNGRSFELVVAKPDANAAVDGLPEELVAQAQKANELTRLDKLEEARDIYREIATRAPESFMAAVNLGVAHHLLEEYSQAIDEFRRALKIQPNEPFALMKLGISEFRAGNTDAAAESLENAVKIDDSNYQAHYFLALAYDKLGKHEEARGELRRALDLKPDYAPALEAQRELQ